MTRDEVKAAWEQAFLMPQEADMDDTRRFAELVVRALEMQREQAMNELVNELNRPPSRAVDYCAAVARAALVVPEDLT